MTVDPRELYVLQLELECKGIVDGDRLVRIPGDEPDDIEPIQVTKYPDGSCRMLVRDDIDDELYARVARMGAEAAFERPELLGVSDWERGRSYIFAADLVAPEGVLEIMREHDTLVPEPWMFRPLFEIHVDGETVSSCRSSRENVRAAEAWVETEPRYRRRGFARAVVAAWACSVRAGGKVAFYSHREDNTPSAGVAARLGLTQWLSYVNIELG